MKRFSLVLPLLLGIGCITFVGGFVWKKRTHTTTLAFADDDTQVLGAHTAHEVTVNAAPPSHPRSIAQTRISALFTESRGN